MDNKVQDATVVAVVAPQAQTMSAEGGPNPGFSALEGRKKFVIKQRFEKLEAAAQAVGLGVVETQNKYDVYDAVTGEPIMFVLEDSSCFCRACFAPHHEAKIHVFDTRQGVAPNTRVMTGMKPWKCGCCAFADICRDEINIIDAQNQPIGSMKVPVMGGGFTPVLEIMDREGKVQYTTQGPTCCTGGLIELCMDMSFNIYDAGNTTQATGLLKKVKPQNFQGALREAAGDADTFMLEVPDSMDSESVARLLQAVIFTDFAHYEGGAPFSCDLFSQTLHVNCCNLYCCGCLCRCNQELKLGGQ